MASLSIVNGTLECPPQEDPHPYRDLAGVFSKHLQAALFPPWIIRRSSMTAWQTHIVGAEWAREWSRWCPTARASWTPAPQYAAVPLEGWGPHTWPRPTIICVAGPDHPWDVAAAEWLQAAPGPTQGGAGMCPRSSVRPSPPASSSTPPTCSKPTEIHTWGCKAATIRWLPPERGATGLSVAHFKDGGPKYDDALSRLSDVPGPLLLMLPTDPPPRAAPGAEEL